MTEALESLNVLEDLEKRYPCGFPIKQNDKVGVVSGYEVANGHCAIILTFEDGHQRKVRVSANKSSVN